MQDWSGKARSTKWIDGRSRFRRIRDLNGYYSLRLLPGVGQTGLNVEYWARSRPAACVRTGPSILGPEQDWRLLVVGLQTRTFALPALVAAIGPERTFRLHAAKARFEPALSEAAPDAGGRFAGFINRR